MEEDTEQLQRRVTGRKRSLDTLPKPNKVARYNTSVMKGVSGNTSEIKSNQQGGWIQNSFVSNQKPSSRHVSATQRVEVDNVSLTNRGESGVKRGVGRVTRDAGRVTRDAGRVTQDATRGSTQDARKETGDAGRNKSTLPSHKAGINDDKIEGIFPSLTSTPIQRASKKDCTAGVNADSETYTSQHHQSFDESDSIFADLDLGTTDTLVCSKPVSVRRSARKASISKHNVNASVRKSSAQKTLSKMETFQRFTQGHPPSDLGKGQSEVKVTSGVEDLMCDSDDSLFGDCGVSDSLLDYIESTSSAIKKLPKKQTETQGNDKETEKFCLKNLSQNKGDSFIDKNVSRSNLNKTQVDIISSSFVSPELCRTQSKRKSVEFRAASGSQLSFEEDVIITDNEDSVSKSNPRDKSSDNPQNNEGHTLKEQTLKVGEGCVAPTTPGCKSALSVTPGVTPGGTGAHTPAGVTPGSVRARLLRDRLRRAGAPASSSRPPARAARLKAEHVEAAVREAEKERATGTEFDIGPFYGLPAKVLELFQQHRGIKTLYDWQNECLTLEAVRTGSNLIYSLPTSGGKTLVAEVLMLKELLCKKKDALFILPFVAIVQEKVKTLTPFALDLDFVVEEYAASKGSMPPRVRRKRRAIYIATIEKAAGLVNSLIEAGRMDEIGLVVIDELHMLGEGGSRGATLEMTLAKLMHVAVDTQLIGMSATLNNISDLSQFMRADVYSSDFRPVELREFVKIDDTVYEINSKALCPDDRLSHSRVCTFKYDAVMQRADPDHLAGLVQEVIPGHSCLVFCPTKKNCENVAQLLCTLLPRELKAVKREAREALLRVLWHEGSGEVCPVLRRTVPYGLAYHHSGLTVDERRLVEEAYLDGTLCLLTCTSTLAAGVNLPAKRVILRAPRVASDFLSRSQYKQMVGRAGRAGLDSSGESILILEKKDRAQLLSLVSGPCDVCMSSLLYNNDKGLRHLLLTTIGLQITPTLDSVSAFLQRTLCFVQRHLQGTDVLAAAQGALQSLVDQGLVQQTVEVAQVTEVKDDGVTSTAEYRLDVTRLGKAVYKGSIDIDRGQQLYDDLRQGQSSLVVANYLHLLYLVTPYDMVGVVKPDWMNYLDQLSKFEEDEMKVVNQIGLSESYIAKKASGQRVRKNVDEAVLNRFYLTLILYNLWQQRSIWEVSDMFRVPRGLVQNILNLSATFGACITHFCQELEEFWAYQDLFGNFVKKLSFCFMQDLMALMEIPGVKAGRARQLYTAGYKTLQQVAFADASSLVRSIEHLPKKIATAIITAAKVLLNERVEALQEEAEQMIATPLSPPPVVGTSHGKTVR